MRRLRYVGRLFGHLWGFASENRAWWMIPLLLVLGLLGGLLIAAEASAPFIYTLW